MKSRSCFASPWERGLLICGIGSSLLYVAMNVLAAMRYDGYSSVSQAVSELSAIGAPSRPLWVALGVVYNLLLIAFGWGVWRAARGSRALRVVGSLFFAQGVLGFAWPPLHPRGQEFGLTDALHIAFTAGMILLFLLTIGFGAAAFGRRFRLYSIATILVHVVFGTLTGMDGPRIAANLPTPWTGLTERINIGVYLLWVITLAVVLLRSGRAVTTRRVSPELISRTAA